jgi:hypothetical protein
VGSLRRGRGKGQEREGRMGMWLRKQTWSRYTVHTYGIITMKSPHVINMCLIKTKIKLKKEIEWVGKNYFNLSGSALNF